MTKIIFRIFALTVLIQSATAAATRTRGRKESLSISWADLFPEQEFAVDENLIPEINENCKNNGVCYHVNNYPVILAHWVLREFQSKNISEFYRENTLESNVDSSHSLCNSTEMTYYPKAAYSTKSKTWKFILNLNVHLARFQGFYVNICNQNESCKGLITDRLTRCEQTYTEKKMLYLDLKKKKTAVDIFKVPICCSCKIM